MIAFVFPGQGSQTRGMGQGLFDEVREFVSCEREIDACLGYSARTLCLTDPGNRLRQTQYTQPCLYLVNALHYYKARAAGERPSFVAGHSVGEYNALLAAEAFDLLTGLRLVKQRGELMALATNGGMAAVVGLDAERIVTLMRRHGLTTLDIANYNSPEQTVISGPIADLARAESIFSGAGARRYTPLPVSAAFHSRYMVSAREAFGALLASFTFKRPSIPVISEHHRTAISHRGDPGAARGAHHEPGAVDADRAGSAGARCHHVQGNRAGAVLTRLIHQTRQAVPA